MFNKLSELMGGGNPQQLMQFAQQAQQDPHNVDPAQLAQHYGNLVQNLPAEQVDAAHEHAFSQMPQQDREALAQHLQQVSQDPNQAFNGYPQNMPVQQAADPRQLGRMVQSAAQTQPNLIQQMVGPNSPLNSTPAKLALAGAAAFMASRYLSK